MTNMSDKNKPRKRRDSSLYRDVGNTPRTEGESSAAQGGASGKDADARFRFVLSSKDPAIVPVEHQAVIEELTASLETIESSKRTLETELGSKNSGNKLQIAQIKGRLADLNRRKTEIESLLGARAAKPDAS
jgi:hypothetical protein